MGRRKKDQPWEQDGAEGRVTAAAVAARFGATPLYASSIFALRERTNDVAR